VLALASSSPRRRELIAACGLVFEVVPPDVDEDPRGETDPVTLAGTLARRKAAAVLAVTSAAYVLAADTVVWARGEILGKPTDDDDARRMLRLLSGTAQRVVTGFAAARTSDGRMISGTVTTIVVMRELSEDRRRRLRRDARTRRQSGRLCDPRARPTAS
jgi:septum formation protein